MFVCLVAIVNIFNIVRNVRSHTTIWLHGYHLSVTDHSNVLINYNLGVNHLESKITKLVEPS